MSLGIDMGSKAVSSANESGKSIDASIRAAPPASVKCPSAAELITAEII